MASEAGEEAHAPGDETPTPTPKAVGELPAPAGWKKTFTPLKKDGTPKRRDVIIFISPDGEEIKTKKGIDRYLKEHPGGPAFSEFDWSTGETPRRSARLSSKANPIESQKESGNKRARKQVKETSSLENEEAKEELAKPATPTIEGSEEAMENVEKADGGRVKDEENELISECVVDEPSKETDTIVQKKPDEESDNLKSKNDAVLPDSVEASAGNEADEEVTLREDPQQTKEGVQQSGVCTSDLNSVCPFPETGSSQIADLQNPSEAVGA